MAVAGDAAAAEAIRIGALFARSGGLVSLAVPALHGVELRAAEPEALADAHPGLGQPGRREVFAEAARHENAVRRRKALLKFALLPS